MKRILTAFLITSLATLTFGQSENGPTTADQQKAMTPDAILKDLMDGNKRYVENTLKKRDYKAAIKATSTGQYPKAVILSCLDSRVPVEQVFDQGIGDIFVGRVAGNVENKDQLGSMEFATKLAGSKLVMVLGHESCGAVKGACDHAKLGNLTALLKKIKPAVDSVEGHEGERTSKNKAFVHEVVVANVHRTVSDIRKKSPVLKKMEDDGEIKIVGALYSLKDGSVTLLK